MPRAVSILLAVAGLGLAPTGLGAAERVRDLAVVQGVRSNQLVGYGLVVGLDGTGDQTSQAPFTVISLKNMLARFGVTIPPNLNPQLKNVAAVSVHAELPPFVKPGQAIDVTVASIGNAGSLRGGSLLMTPLRGADGEVYAVAQGSLVVGGFGVSGKDGSRIALNVPSGGRIPNGAIVEREVPTHFATQEYVIFNLRTPDFVTASRLTDAINARFGAGTAAALDAVSVRVAAPRDVNERIAYVAALEQLEVEPGEAPARVIVNSRTGTVVIGNRVRVMPAAVSHGALAVTITERLDVSQPNPFAAGETAVVPRSEVSVEEPQARMFKFPAGVDLDDIVRAVNEVGAAPGDLVAILEALQQAGALRAELIVI
ncbi:MAG: flagellar basal body P-ring protein FlgI [Steroidobacteraceae bacterium]|nr:flagellar basal body P-ring protein FlgI [Steroidobacteraceae bacterium]MDW8258078.1 flagellar basal body P-ring protein FlgI [Gammaproteobacteria bacterium]